MNSLFDYLGRLRLHRNSEAGKIQMAAASKYFYVYGAALVAALALLNIISIAIATANVSGPIDFKWIFMGVGCGTVLITGATAFILGTLWGLASVSETTLNICKSVVAIGLYLHTEVLAHITYAIAITVLSGGTISLLQIAQIVVAALAILIFAMFGLHIHCCKTFEE